MNGKSVVAVVAAAGVLCGVALAQTGGKQARGAGGRSSELTDYLGLTPEQRDQFKAMREEHQKETEPLRAEGRQLHQKLRAAMESEKADPTAVGKAMLAVKAHGEKMKASHEAFRSRMRAQLTPEQAQKFEALEAARQFDRGQRGPHGGRGSQGAGRPWSFPGGPGGHSSLGGPGGGPGFGPDDDLPPPPPPIQG